MDILYEYRLQLQEWGPGESCPEPIYLYHKEEYDKKQIIGFIEQAKNILLKDIDYLTKKIERRIEGCAYYFFKYKKIDAQEGIINILCQQFGFLAENPSIKEGAWLDYDNANWIIDVSQSGIDLEPFKEKFDAWQKQKSIEEEQKKIQDSQKRLAELAGL